MKLRPDLCCNSHNSMANRIISTAPSRICLSIYPWFAMEKAVQGGLTTRTVGQSLRIRLLTSPWSLEFLRSYVLPELGSRKAMSMGHPPLSPRFVAEAHILGGENTSQTSYLFFSSLSSFPRIRTPGDTHLYGPVSATRVGTGVQDNAPCSSSSTSAHDLLSLEHSIHSHIRDSGVTLTLPSDFSKVEF